MQALTHAHTGQSLVRYKTKPNAFRLYLICKEVTKQSMDYTKHEWSLD